MLNKNNTGLIVVDVQGKLARIVNDSDLLIENCAKLIKGAQILGLPIVWLEQNPDKLGATVEELSILLPEQKAITKFTFDGCTEPEVMQAIHQADIETWLVCGIETHICVYQTAMSLINKIMKCSSLRIVFLREQYKTNSWGLINWLAKVLN